MPASWGKAHGLDRSIDTVLNRAPLSAETNRNWISDRLPNEYLPKLITANGEQAVRANLETHFISPAAFDILLRSPFAKEDFQDFIGERKRTILEAIENLLVKERLDLSPTLRDLDGRIEQVELALRKLLEAKLSQAAIELPDHIKPKVLDRMQRDQRKGLIADSGTAFTLGQSMEYLDMRELHDVIIAKQTWPIFENTFSAKEQFQYRFGQLAELRNGIRHSRSVSPIAKKDGEAALMWFDSILDKTSE